MRWLVTLVYAALLLAVATFLGAPGAIAVLSTLAIAAYFERHRDLLIISALCAAILGGLVIPMARMIGPENIPLYAGLGAVGALITTELLFLRTRFLRRRA